MSNTARRIIVHDPNRDASNNAHDPNGKVLNNARVGMIPATGNCHKSFSRKDLRRKRYRVCVTPSLASTYEDSHSTPYANPKTICICRGYVGVSRSASTLYSHEKNV